MRQQHFLLTMCIILFSCLASNESIAAISIDLRHQPTLFLNTFAVSENQITFKTLSRSTDSNHVQHVHIQQMYQGYPVWGADAKVHTPAAGSAQSPSMNGIVYQALRADLVDTPSSVFLAPQMEKAKQQALQWYEKTHIVHSPLSASATFIVYVNKEQKACWSFLVSMRGNDQHQWPIQQIIIMDALNFAVYQQWSNVKSLQETLSGGFGGNKKIGKLIYDGLAADYPAFTIERNAHTKMCYLENSDVTVRDARQEGAIASFMCQKKEKQYNDVYWDADQDAANGAYSPSNDALYIGKIIKNMYQEWYQIPVLLDEQQKPLMLNMVVHAPMSNACWDGQKMIFGDGADDFYPLVSLTVAAHEISHGFTQQQSGLNYEGQAGGLNESFSDIAAAAAEYYTKKTNSWRIGDDITKQKNRPFRYMDEPIKDCDGRVPGDQCSIDQATDYVEGMDVHFSSGVFNKLFYLLSTSKDWDTKKAFDVMVQANRYYWTSSSDFNQAACGVLKAADDYHYSLTALKRAIKAVGIDASAC